jgi:soluble lytic murein transglycosylase
MTDKEKHAAAHLAIKWDLPNWSILALAKADNKDDLSLRFPVVYTKHILKEAQKHQIDPAWILAVTRQESAFVPHAKSAAGAVGLMQLIPSTAHMVARKKQIPFSSSSNLLEPHTNIQLGSGYLKMMLEQHRNNSVLATAAYNAGPGRIRKWLPTFDMAADLWIETIPYKETREYVKNVLTYTAIYQEILGGKPTLARHMPFIPSGKDAGT